jgi:excisionase family DNA binding protein
MSSKLMSLKEFADHLGVSYSTVRRMVVEKKVRVVMPHRRAMIPASEAAKYISSAKKDAAPDLGDRTEASGPTSTFPADLNC